jgi:hypothetical protein
VANELKSITVGWMISLFGNTPHVSADTSPSVPSEERGRTGRGKGGGERGKTRQGKVKGDRREVNRRIAVDRYMSPNKQLF